MTAENLLAYAGQIAIVVLACAGLPRVLGLRAPGPQYAFWRAVLVVCLLLPFVQPWKPVVMAFSPAPHGVGPSSTLPPGLDAPAPAGSAPIVTVATAVQGVLVFGIAARLAWIGLGMIRLRRMRRDATDEALGFDDLKQAIGAGAPILWSTDVRHPVTFGFFNPVVLLPLALKQADAAAQRAVIAHELHHVKRRDWGWVVAEELVRSVFWFHPAVWWLVSRVQLARETVVDELSILVTNARRTYLDTLLAFADDTGLATSPAFSARRHLFHRVVLLSKEGEMSSIHVALGSCVLMAALGAGSFEAVQAFPLYGEMKVVQGPLAQEQQPPPRDPVSPERLHSTAVRNFDQVMSDTTLTVGQKRELILKGIAAEDQALAIRPDYLNAILYKNILLRMQANLADDPQEMNDLIKQADALRNRAMDLTAAGVKTEMVFHPNGAVPPPPPPAPGPPPGWQEHQALVDQYKPVRVGGNVMMPAKVHDVRPIYPPVAQSAGVQGVVIAEVLIDAAGQVAEAWILRSIPLLDQAALTAVRQWEFMPTQLNGAPTAVLMTVTVNFSLQR